MNVKILLFRHLQIILGDNPHYSNAMTGVKLVMVSSQRGGYVENASIKKSTLTPRYVAPVMSTISEQVPFLCFSVLSLLYQAAGVKTKTTELPDAA